MAARLDRINWTDHRPITDIVEVAKERGIDYLLVGSQPQAVAAEVLQQAILQNPSADAIDFVDATHPARDARFTSSLPPIIRLIAGLPQQDLAVAISVRSPSVSVLVLDVSQSLCEFVVRLAESGTVAFVEATSPLSPGYAIPQLTAPAVRPQQNWLRQIIERFHVVDANAVTLTALRAGLFLLNDLFDESHSCSQSIEGEGRYHTGDYWHAILHRREPDYDNSKYWFRRVGRHPIFAELVTRVAGETTRRECARVVANGGWDPVAFVDVCAAAERDRELKVWCERVQYLEMLLLLEHSYREATGLASSYSMPIRERC